METLTDRQAQMLEFVRAYAAEHDGVGPPLKLMADHFGFGEPAAHHHLEKLRRKGYVERHSGQTRVLVGRNAPPAVLEAYAAGWRDARRSAVGDWIMDDARAKWLEGRG